MIEADLNTLIAAITAAILALIGYLNVKRTEQSGIIAASTAQTAQTNATLVSLTPPAPYQGVDTRIRDSNGNLINNMTHGSQWWMNANYTGPEPSLATKAMFSTAEYAYANAAAIVNEQIKKYGRENIDPALLAYAKI